MYTQEQAFCPTSHSHAARGLFSVSHPARATPYCPTDLNATAEHPNSGQSFGSGPLHTPTKWFSPPSSVSPVWVSTVTSRRLPKLVSQPTNHGGAHQTTNPLTPGTTHRLGRQDFPRGAPRRGQEAEARSLEDPEGCWRRHHPLQRLCSVRPGPCPQPRLWCKFFLFSARAHPPSVLRVWSNIGSNRSFLHATPAPA